MRILLFLFTILLFCQFSRADETQFGQYRYSQYLGIQQQLQNQRTNAIRKQRMHYQDPTRNIRYPSMNNPYPNIQRGSYAARLTPRQRYSAQYYRSL
ncbi:MAG: hypothetical protein IKU37_00650 [Candidatus Gastranaerophilales bacterium]|nr:hypothetical protein [Candidatus Gastranaerophilales bacterium]